MKVAFVFDTVLLKKGNDYYGMTLTYKLFERRYLNNADTVIVVTREDKKSKHEKESSGYEKTNGKNVHVEPSRYYKKITDVFRKGYKIRNELEKSLLAVDRVIIRMPSVLGVYAAKICRKHKKPYFVECVASAYDGYSNHTNPAGKIIAFPMHFFTRGVIRNASHVLYVTNDYLQSKYPTKGKSCACSDVVLPQCNNKSDFIIKKKIRKLYTVGNVEMKYKGHIYVFRALRKINKNNSENMKLDYYLVGGGNNNMLRKKAKRMKIEKNIHFVGSLNHDDLMSELRNADIYIQPSLTEGLSRALIEAMSVGCPSIASSAGGNPELLPKEYIFKTKNYKQLIKRIMFLVSVDERKKASERNRSYAERFSGARYSDKRDAFYKDYLMTESE